MSTSTRPAKGTSFLTEWGTEWRVTSVRKAWDGQVLVYATPAAHYVDGGSNKALDSWSLNEWNALYATAPAVVEPYPGALLAALEDAVAEYDAADAAAAEKQATTEQVPAVSTDEQLRDRLLAGGASPERAQMVVDARNQLQRELTAAAPAIAAALEDEPHPHPCPCGCHLGPAPDPELREQAHVEALAEDAAHDAATVAAMPMNAYLAQLDLGMPRRLPQTLRTMAGAQRYLSPVPPRPAL